MSDASITLVLPYYNEVDFLPGTLASLAAQSDRRFKLVLVDNASTDGSAEVARTACSSLVDVEVMHLTEAQPGKLFALITGLAACDTTFVATLDADTIYPADYVARTIALFGSSPEIVSVLAFGLVGQAPVEADAAPRLQLLYSDYLPNKCHTGGFGQAFRLAELREVGGFDPEIWPYVLEDHEIIHRIGQRGRLAYERQHVCYPSDRREGARDDCSWTLFERFLYKSLPNAAMDWFFYDFLATRFEKRGLNNIKLRRKIWQEKDVQSG